ncbi:MAG TPA: peptidylprolyl isomerase [Salegentibacter sp.]|uniref:peptidylprolyl isomerase n=1 Tax=Salegentibacter sp. TaxID=1903072 RepID=UPI002F95C72D
MKTTNIFILLAMALTLFACNDEYPDLEDGLYAEFETNKGSFVAELFYEQTPITVASFVSLAEGNNTMVDSTYKNKNFYDGIRFHRIIEGFVIQGGDPTGTGSGGPGYRFPDEVNNELSHDSKGVLSMANAGPGTNGSQFFITLGPTPNLDGRHTIFGEIVKGQDVVDSIGKVKTDPSDRPVEEVIIEKVNIIKKGGDAKNFDAPKVFENKLSELKAEEEEAQKRMEDAMAENSEKFSVLKEEAKELESGLQIYFEEEGDGEKPADGQMVQLNYEGYFQDGRIFDTNNEDLAQELGLFSQQRKDQGGYESMTIPYGPEAPMIPGFKEGVQQMRVGDKAILYIPSHLAYGESGAGGVIPPNTDLIFRVELVGIQE